MRSHGGRCSAPWGLAPLIPTLFLLPPLPHRQRAQERAKQVDTSQYKRKRVKTSTLIKSNEKQNDQHRKISTKTAKIIKYTCTCVPYYKEKRKFEKNIDRKAGEKHEKSTEKQNNRVMKGKLRKMLVLTLGEILTNTLIFKGL